MDGGWSWWVGLGQVWQFLVEIFLFLLLSVRLVAVVLRAVRKSHKKKNIPSSRQEKKRPKTKLSREEPASKKTGLAWVLLPILPHLRVIVDFRCFFFLAPMHCFCSF